MRLTARLFITCVAMLATILVTDAPVGATFDPLPAPRRIADTRPGEPTFDSQFAGAGLRQARTTYSIQVAGRAGVPADATTVVLNVTSTQSTARGYITVIPCGETPTSSSSVNFAAGQTIANTVVARLSASGTVCLYTHSPTHLVVDVAGTLPSTTYQALAAPQRLVDTRPGEPTIDSQFQGAGIRPAASTYEVQIAGRAGVPADSTSAVLNVTSTGSLGRGYATVFPCGTRPNASSLNFADGQTIANAVVARLSVSGTVCLYTHQPTHLVVDVAGTLDLAGGYTPIATPQRLADTRPGEPTFDQQFQGAGMRPSGGTYPVTVAGRGSIPANATSVVLTVTSTQASARGFVTAHPRGTDRPTASNLNFAAGQTIANTVIAKVGAGGQICLYSHAATHLVVDVAGYMTGGDVSAPSGACPADPPPPPAPARTFQPGQYLVNSQIPAGRYIGSAASGCYWERQNGLGGTLDEINANDFRGHAGRIIVDIEASDLAFEFDHECGSLTTYQGQGGMSSSIGPGDHVVGVHINPGTYRSTVESGCYWQRVSGFNGTLSQVIANDFVSTAGQQFVTVSATDVGFSSDDDCGTWTRVS